MTHQEFWPCYEQHPLLQAGNPSLNQHASHISANVTICQLFTTEQDDQQQQQVKGCTFNTTQNTKTWVSIFMRWNTSSKKLYTSLTGASLSRITASWLSISFPNSVFKRSPEFPTTAHVLNWRGRKGGFPGNNKLRCSSQRDRL